MRVCVITTSFPRSIDDYSGVFIFRLCRSMAALNVDIDVVAPADERGSPPLARLGPCHVHRFSYFFPRRWQKLGYGPGGIPANLNRTPFLLFQVPFFVLSFLLKAYRVAGKADLIHAHWVYSGWIGWAVSGLRGIPFIVTLRGEDVLRARKNGMTFSFSIWILKRASMVTTVNEEFRNWLISEGFPEERVVFIRNGVHSEEKRGDAPLSSACRLLFVGSLIPRKGVRYLLEAFSRVIRQEDKVKLVLIGDGEERELLQEQVEREGIGGFVEFVGIRPADEISRWMHLSDGLVLPSLWEGTPNVVLEAMASGLPVVVSDLPGIREFISDGVNGFLVKPQDVDDLANKLLRVVRDQALRRRVGESAQQTISKMNLGWEQVAKRYSEIYQKICAGSRESTI
jgi:glycosyltransferase involved in cell wall biosynthesis